MTEPSTISADRLARRREHLMSEIVAGQIESPSTNARRFVARRGLRLPAMATVAAAAVAATIGLTAGTGAGLGPVAFALAPVPGGNVAITVVNTKASAAQMTNQLHKQGLDITIKTVSATPQLVGRWLAVSTSNGTGQQSQRALASQALGKVATISVPRNFGGKILLYVGVPTAKGHNPDVAGLPNALAPGGKFYCQHLQGASPNEALGRLTKAGYSVRWAFSPNGPALAAPAAGTRVTEAFLRDFNPQNVAQVIANPRTVTVVLAEPGTANYAAQLRQGFPAVAPSATACDQPVG